MKQAPLIEHMHGSVFVEPGLPRDEFFYLLGDMPARYPVPAVASASMIMALSWVSFPLDYAWNGGDARREVAKLLFNWDLLPPEYT